VERGLTLGVGRGELATLRLLVYQNGLHDSQRWILAAHFAARLEVEQGRVGGALGRRRSLAHAVGRVGLVVVEGLLAFARRFVARRTSERRGQMT